MTSPDATRQLLDLLAGARVFDLGLPMRNGMAQSPNHPAFRHCLDRRHGDHVADDGGSVASDLVTLGCHVGTHVDGLGHISHDGRLHGGASAAEAQAGGRFGGSWHPHAGAVRGARCAAGHSLPSRRRLL